MDVTRLLSATNYDYRIRGQLGLYPIADEANEPLSNEIGVNADANLQLSDADMETLKVFQESIDTENAEVVDAYNAAKTKKANGSDKIDAQIVNDMDDELPEQVLSK